MDSKSKHIIRKVFLEVETGSLKTAYYLRDHLDIFLKNEIFPLLENCFNNVLESENPASLQMERLHVELNLKEHDLTGNFSELKKVLQKEMEKEVQKQGKREVQKQREKEVQKETEELSATNASQEDSGNARLVSPERRLYNTFFHFIKTGKTPWWASPEDMDIVSSPREIRLLFRQKSFSRDIEDVLRDKIAVKRLIRQLPGAVLKEIFEFCGRENAPLLSLLSPISKENDGFSVLNTIGGDQYFNSPPSSQKIWELLLDRIKKRTEECTTRQKEQLWCLLAEMVPGRSKTEIQPVLTLLFSLLSGEKTAESSNKLSCPPAITPSGEMSKNDVPYHRLTENIETDKYYPISSQGNKTPGQEEFFPVTESEKQILVDNAGLILLHPFLKPFFLDCGVITPDNVFTDKELAAHLLHYTATGKEMDTENFMVLEKFLCNIPLHRPITREISISGKLKKKCGELLLSLVQEWEAVKNTSPETVRHEFIQRPGKLVLEKDNPGIIVERKTQDILLEKLPWNISIVKIPWIKKLIFVEW